METKSNLIQIAKLLGVSIRSSLRKEDYVNTLSELILTCPDKWLCQLPYYELTLLQKLVNAGPDAYVEEPDPQFDIMLCVLSLVVTDDSKTFGKIRYMISGDLREAIVPYLDAALAVNPHFLFNSLNVLVSLINKDSQRATDYTKK